MDNTMTADRHSLDINLCAIFDTIQDELPHLDFAIPPPIPLPRDAKLRLKKSELQLLAASLQQPSPPSWEKILPNPRRVRNIKVEVPLLTGCDVNLRSSSRRPTPDLEDFHVFSDCTGLPTKLFEPAAEWAVKLSQEKLQATKADLLYLQRVLQDPYTAEEYQQVLKDALPSFTRKSLLDDEEVELQEDKHLQDLQNQSPPLSQKRPLSPPTVGILSNSCQQFSATRSLLGFIRTRGDNPKKLKSNSHIFSEVQRGDGMAL